MIITTNTFAPFRVVALNGSLRKYSTNAGIIQEAKSAFNELTSVSVLQLDSLPFYNSDIETELPPSVSDFLEALGEANGYIISTPEFNMSFTGVLKKRS
jgi:chromate reductase, NAD(P)H dehydrogenase (quinone)